MKLEGFPHVANLLCAAALLVASDASADEKSDMDRRMLECAATTATNKLGECLSGKGAPAVSARESDAQIHAAAMRCMERGVTGTTEFGACVNEQLDAGKTGPADVTDAQIREATRLCATHYTETENIAVCVETIIRHTGYANR
jgi:hypothetical protein